MSDPQDRHMADLFESELRHKAALDPGNSWELIWFLRLPLETRCSYMRILEARIDQDSARRSLFRQSCYRQGNWRSPTLDVMMIEPVNKVSNPWSSIGQRQRRKPTGFGRSTARRPRISSSTVTDKAKLPPSTATAAPKRRPRQPKLDPTPAPPDPVDSYAVPPRPKVPPDVLSTLCKDMNLRIQASGFNPDTLDAQRYSPCVPATPVPLPELLEPVRYEPFPLRPPSAPGPIICNGKKVPRLWAYFIAAGRHHVAPWQGYTMDEATRDLVELEEQLPGFLNQLVKVLFPSGLNDMGAAAVLSPLGDTLQDFIRGWSIVPMAWIKGQMPIPVNTLCSCGEIRTAC